MDIHFKDHMNLARFVVNKYEIYPPMEYEDMMQEAFIGLWKAVQTFKPEKNYQFATYATRCIYNQVNMYIRKIRRRKEIATLDHPLPQKDGTEVNVTNRDLLPASDSDPEDDIIVKDIVERIFDYAPDAKIRPHVEQRERVYFSYLLKGYKQIEITQIIGTSQRNCSTHTTRIRERVRKYRRKADEKV